MCEMGRSPGLEKPERRPTGVSEEATRLELDEDAVCASDAIGTFSPTPAAKAVAFVAAVDSDGGSQVDVDMETMNQQRRRRTKLREAEEVCEDRWYKDGQKTLSSSKMMMMRREQANTYRACRGARQSQATTGSLYIPPKRGKKGGRRTAGTAAEEITPAAQAVALVADIESDGGRLLPSLPIAAKGRRRKKGADAAGVGEASASASASSERITPAAQAVAFVADIESDGNGEIDLATTTHQIRRKPRRRSLRNPVNRDADGHRSASSMRGPPTTRTKPQSSRCAKCIGSTGKEDEVKGNAEGAKNGTRNSATAGIRMRSGPENLNGGCSRTRTTQSRKSGGIFGCRQNDQRDATVKMTPAAEVAASVSALDSDVGLDAETVTPAAEAVALISALDSDGGLDAETGTRRTRERRKTRGGEVVLGVRAKSPGAVKGRTQKAQRRGARPGRVASFSEGSTLTGTDKEDPVNTAAITGDKQPVQESSTNGCLPTERQQLLGTAGPFEPMDKKPHMLSTLCRHVSSGLQQPMGSVVHHQKSGGGVYEPRLDYASSQSMTAPVTAPQLDTAADSRGDVEMNRRPRRQRMTGAKEENGYDGGNGIGSPHRGGDNELQSDEAQDPLASQSGIAPLDSVAASPRKAAEEAGLDFTRGACEESMPVLAEAALLPPPMLSSSVIVETQAVPSKSRKSKSASWQKLPHGRLTDVLHSRGSSSAAREVEGTASENMTAAAQAVAFVAAADSDGDEPLPARRRRVRRKIVQAPCDPAASCVYEMRRAIDVQSRNLTGQQHDAAEVADFSGEFMEVDTQSPKECGGPGGGNVLHDNAERMMPVDFETTAYDHISAASSSDDGVRMLSQQLRRKKRREEKKQLRDRQPHSDSANAGVAEGTQQAPLVNPNWVPPASAYCLIQEKLYTDPWKVLIACILLHKTGGHQMHKVIWDLFELIPTPEAAIAASEADIANVIRSLGLYNKRAKMIKRFSEEYLRGDWTDVTQLHGIGKYGADAYAIFCQGRWREVQPEDHVLTDYWRFLHATDGQGFAFHNG
ncbi:hypothetical protein CBR_g51322 [Chara braunii]|uniref:Methyl-CpG-binding domain protein 4 n=1 Tax=Chara braunii TaxID=69332 RepID=A0A388M898_CHABU|nr:hypothetical protein CBR_g51322 [Chara braunii]|eukprot:GBG90817.1 hypothetical protein CBR_g51322 [Chara braunii]